jgi:hypothetical protein
VLPQRLVGNDAAEGVCNNNAGPVLGDGFGDGVAYGLPPGRARQVVLASRQNVRKRPGSLRTLSYLTQTASLAPGSAVQIVPVRVSC